MISTPFRRILELSTLFLMIACEDCTEDINIIAKPLCSLDVNGEKQFSFSINATPECKKLVLSYYYNDQDSKSNAISNGSTINLGNQLPTIITFKAVDKDGYERTQSLLNDAFFNLDCNIVNTTITSNSITASNDDQNPLTNVSDQARIDEFERKNEEARIAEEKQKEAERRQKEIEESQKREEAVRKRQEEARIEAQKKADANRLEIERQLAIERAEAKKKADAEKLKLKQEAAKIEADRVAAQKARVEAEKLVKEKDEAIALELKRKARLEEERIAAEAAKLQKQREELERKEAEERKRLEEEAAAAAEAERKRLKEEANRAKALEEQRKREEEAAQKAKEEANRLAEEAARIKKEQEDLEKKRIEEEKRQEEIKKEEELEANVGATSAGRTTPIPSHTAKAETKSSSAVTFLNQKERGGISSANKCAEDKKSFVKGPYTVSITPKRNVRLENFRVYANQKGNVDLILTTIDWEESETMEDIYLLPTKSGTAINVYALGVMLEANTSYTLTLNPQEDNLELESTHLCTTNKFSTPTADISYSGDKVVFFDFQFIY